MSRRLTSLLPPLVLLALALTIPARSSADDAERFAGIEAAARRVDERVAEHWRSVGVAPAPECDDLTFVRRVTLDLAGRLPTAGEAKKFAEDPSSDKRSRLIRELAGSHEFVTAWGYVLDGMIQEDDAGNNEFVAYLRRGLKNRKGWDAMFREMMIGPWDSDDSKEADRFLEKRVGDVDRLTRDATSAFFGVDVTCAKCHDHPLVPDWKQSHYYGMQSFFSRTYQFRAKNKSEIAEKSTGRVTFADVAGQSHDAELMFLTGERVAEPPEIVDPRAKDREERAKEEGRWIKPEFSRREALVETALTERRFFSRAIVNKFWSYLHGRGVVDPIDQMHSGNDPSVPGVIDALADDLVEHDYDLARLAAVICATSTYQRSSEPLPGEPPAPEHFAFAALRELTPIQFATALVGATGDAELYPKDDAEDRAGRRGNLDSRARGLTRRLDRRIPDFQSSAVEALYLSNNSAVQDLVKPNGENLAARMVKLGDANAAVELAFWSAFGRAPTDDERGPLVVHWNESEDRGAAAARIVWALATSAEFRFNH